jgi:hypothetical protein
MRPFFPVRIGELPFGAVGIVEGPRPLRLAYFEACLDLEDDLFLPVAAPDGLFACGLGRRGNYERLSRQIDRRRTSARG